MDSTQFLWWLKGFLHDKSDLNEKDLLTLKDELAKITLSSDPNKQTKIWWSQGGGWAYVYSDPEKVFAVKDYLLQKCSQTN